MNVPSYFPPLCVPALLSQPQSTVCLCTTACLSHFFPSYVCRKAPCCASERNSPKTGSLSCRCWKDILTLFDFWCRLMTSGKQTTTPPPPPPPLPFSLFLTSLLSTLGWPLSLCDWQEILTYRKLTEHDKSPIITTMWLCVCTVQYNQSPLMLSIHTCTHTHKGCAPALLSALLCGSMLHTGMVEWLCISGQIGIYNN